MDTVIGYFCSQALSFDRLPNKSYFQCLAPLKTWWELFVTEEDTDWFGQYRRGANRVTGLCLIANLFSFCQPKKRTFRMAHCLTQLQISMAVSAKEAGHWKQPS